MAQNDKKHKAIRFLPVGIILLFMLNCNLSQALQTDAHTDQTTTMIFSLEEQNQLFLSASQTAAANNLLTQTSQPIYQASSTSTNANNPSATPQSSSTSTLSSINMAPLDTKQIYFKQGGTSAYDHQHIASGQEITYVLNVSEGQTMIAGVSSSNNDVYLDIQGSQYGQQLVSSAVKRTDWTGTMPATQTYLITLSTTNPGTDFYFSVEIPANIVFDQGKDAITLDGYIDIHKDLHPDIITRVSYLAYAAAGQTMTINITSPNIDSLSLGIYGQSDGQPYKRYEVRGTSGSFELPKTQGYYINVYSTGAVSTAFTLEVTIQ